MKMKQKDNLHSFKIVLIGDSGVGKSSICFNYIQSIIFQPQVKEEVAKNYNATIKIGDQFINLGIWDTACKTQFKDLRRLSYVNADAFMIVFSIDSKLTFRHAVQMWFNEITNCCPDASIIFVGNKSDLRYNSANQIELLSRDHIIQTIKMLKSYLYVQCSALTCDGITDIFLQCTKQILSDKLKRKKQNKKYEKLQNCNNCLVM